jgi:DNA-binding MarR family transcriptional regulator
MADRKGSKDEGKPRGLDIGQLAFFVGMAANEAVMGRMRGEGFVGLRQSHGFVVQHLLAGPRSVTELARLLGVTQQAASKRVAELAEHGYVEDVDSADARRRSVQLSERGHACVAASRAARRSLEGELREAIGDRAVTSAKKVLQKALEQLGGAEAVRRRRVRLPR